LFLKLLVIFLIKKKFDYLDKVESLKVIGLGCLGVKVG